MNDMAKSSVPAKESEVDRELQLLISNVNELNDLFNALQDRISVIIRPEPPMEETSKDMEEIVPLANTLRHNSIKIIGFRKRMECLFGRIEL